MGNGETAYETIASEPVSWSLWLDKEVSEFKFSVSGREASYYGDMILTATASGTVTDVTRWNHVLAVCSTSVSTYLSEPGNVLLWVNGVQGTGDHLIANSLVRGSDLVIGGVSHSGVSVPRVRDVAIWDTIPSDLFEPSKGRVRNPLAFYRFRGDDTNRLLDSSGNSHHLTMDS